MAHTRPSASRPSARRALAALVCLLVPIALCTSAARGAETITARSGRHEDLQAAVDVAKPGDTVIIPAGTWDATGTVRLPEGIHVRGEGVDRTILKRSQLGRRWESIFRVDGATGAPFTLSHMTLASVARQRLAAGDTAAIDRGIEFNGPCRDVRVHHCRFTGFTHAAVLFYGAGRALPGHATGVVDNCEFIDMFYTNPGRMSLGYGVAVHGDPADWSLHLGGPEAVFVEDNYFERCRHCIASNGGSRYVFRHNTVQDNYYPFQAVDAHGQGVHPRGSRSYEIYDNTIRGGIDYRTGKVHGTWPIGIRGGDGVIFGNRIDGVWRAVLLVVEGGIRGKTYPAPDQTTDLWLWDNTLNGEPITRVWAGLNNEQTAFFQEGRDYHFGPKPGYVPYTYPHPLRTPEPPEPGTNGPLVKNGSFDAGRRYWEIEVRDPEAGLYAVEDGALLLQRTGGDSIVRAWQDVPVEPGAQYALDYNLRTDGQAGGTVVLSAHTAAEGWFVVWQETGRQQAEDEAHVGTRVVPPAGADGMRITLALAPGEGRAWFDRLALRRAPASPDS
jgi:hypothetical protein